MSHIEENSSDNKIVPRRYGREPSKGCETCRRLKIKCDETHPICSRCGTRGLSCVYRDYSLLMFRDETLISAGKVRRRVRTKQQERANSDALPILLAEPNHIHLSVQPMAINRFFHDFIGAQPPLSNPNARLLPLIPKLFLRCESHPCFTLALSAIANANFAGRCNSDEARWKGLHDYSRALQYLREKLPHQSSHPVTTDMLAASSLLAMYELLVSRDLSQRGSFTAHVNGAMAVLGSESPNDRGIDAVAGGGQDITFNMLTDCLIMGTHPKLPIQNHASIRAQETLPALMLMSMYRAAQLCATWKDFCSTKTDIDPRQQKYEMDSLLEKCRLLDDEIETWTQNKFADKATVLLANAERNIPKPFRSLFTALGAPMVLRLFVDMNQTHWFNFSRACRLTLLKTMVAIVDASSALTTSEDNPAGYKLSKALMLVKMNGLVDDLFSTTFSTLTVHIPGKTDPQSMADVQGLRGLMLLWPLHTAGSCLISMGHHCPDGIEKLQWIGIIFRCIRDDLGIRAANYFLQSNRKLCCRQNDS